MKNEEIIKKIEHRIEELKEKAEMLVLERESLSKRIEDINLELTQIVGALKEFNLIKQD
jgi:methyl-accepting chemotaxis protein